MDTEILFFIVLLCSRIHGIISLTHHGDSLVLQGLKNSFENPPATWNKSNDPCDSWEGVLCETYNGGRVTVLYLPLKGLKGQLGGVIGGLTKLTTLELSDNMFLTGPLPPQLGNLINLNYLSLSACNFTGNIPDELGNLTQLLQLDLSGNKLSGKIPPSLGKLSNLIGLDLSMNQLSGQLPVSTGKTPGLDLLLRAEVLRFNDNELSGSIPSKLFSPNMTLMQLSLSRNQLNGKIPDSIGLVQGLQIVWLNQNALSGNIPSTINNLKYLSELDLSQNKLSGVLPNLSKLASLRSLSLSNNSFDAAEAPTWLSALQSLQSLEMEYGSLHGPVPTKLFNHPVIHEMKLRNNAFNGTLDMSGATDSYGLRLIDLQNNHISSLTIASNCDISITLKGNPICAKALPDTKYCNK